MRNHEQPPQGIFKASSRHLCCFYVTSPRWTVSLTTLSAWTALYQGGIDLDTSPRTLPVTNTAAGCTAPVLHVGCSMSRLNRRSYSIHFP